MGKESMEDMNTQGLVLYEYQSCPFCFITRRTIKQLNVKIERRDILKNSEYKRELLEGGGKSQVPCLRIEDNQNVTWLYESAVINRYLKDTFSG